MRRFYFDVSDGDVYVPDVDGTQYSDRLAVRDEAMEILSDLGRNALPDGDYRTFAVRVRNERKAMIYTATLVASGRWLAD